MGTFSKQDLVKKVALSNDLANGTDAEASRIIELVIETITDELASGNDVNISGLCKFAISEQAAKTGKVPGTDKTYSSPAKKVVKIKAVKHLRDAVL